MEDENKEEKKYLSFQVYKVNDYDLKILKTEAKELAIQHIGITKTKTDLFFDGTIGDKLVKIIDFNHPLTKLDLDLIKKELKKRDMEKRNVVIVCLGKETTIDPDIGDYNKRHPVNKLSTIELKTDPKYGGFFTHDPSIAEVSIVRKNKKALIEINDFISPTIIKRLNDQQKTVKIKIEDFRSMIDVVLIDNNYDGNVFNIYHSDVPEKKNDLVEGKYEVEISDEKVKVAVKIIDMLGEELIIVEEI
jgi:hypothetical protein